MAPRTSAIPTDHLISQLKNSLEWLFRSISGSLEILVGESSKFTNHRRRLEPLGNRNNIAHTSANLDGSVDVFSKTHFGSAIVKGDTDKFENQICQVLMDFLLPRVELLVTLVFHGLPANGRVKIEGFLEVIAFELSPQQLEYDLHILERLENEDVSPIQVLKFNFKGLLRIQKNGL